MKAKSFSQLDPIAKQAVWHFIQGNREGSDVGAITNPWKYGYTQNRQLDLYPEWSKLCLDYEFALVLALEDEDASHEFLVDFETLAERIAAKLEE